MASSNGWNAPRSPVAPSNGASSLHESFNSLSFSSVKSPTVTSATSPAANGNAEDGATRPMPIRTPSAGSLPAAQAAIGSGRSGTSPPSRFNPDINSNGVNQQDGGQTLNNGYNGGSYSSSHSQHTPSHQLPWPTSAGSAASSQSFAQQQQHPGNNARNAQAPRTNGHSGSAATANGNGHDDLPGLAANAESGNRFGLSQPQFNLDHAQLAKSREQRDLDDVDSGQRASATLWMGDLEGWMDETYIVRQAFPKSEQGADLSKMTASLHNGFRLG